MLRPRVDEILRYIGMVFAVTLTARARLVLDGPKLA
jgi:hypothetical protein